MGDVETAARELVDYDRRVAEHVLRLLARDLGVEEAELDRLHAALTNLYPAEDGEAKSTREWKIDFGQRERLRTFALRLTELLAPPW